MDRYILGLDVGGTKIEANVFKIATKASSGTKQIALSTAQEKELYIETLAIKRIPTDRHEGYEAVITRMAKLCEDVSKEAKVAFEDMLGVGLGLPGTINPKTQIMLNGNTGIFIGKNLGTDLNKKLGNKLKRTLCNNDASCFALAEALCGAGLIYQKENGTPIAEQVGIGIILGTGTGGGIIVGGEILNGKNGGGGEIGHIQLVHDGHPCYCGRFGCAEQYLCGPALEAQMNSRLYSQIKERPSTQDIFEMAKNKEPQALATLHLYRHHLVEFLVNLTTIFDPDYFVLGGGVSKQELIYIDIEQKVAQQSFTPSSPRIYKHALSDSAGVLGAAICLL